MNNKEIALFDLDGVLVSPGGYRTAAKAAIQYFLDLMGINGAALDNRFFEHFEAIGISSEWDMIPLTVAIYLEEALQITEISDGKFTLIELMNFIKQKGIQLPKVRWDDYFKKIKAVLVKELSPSESVLSDIKNRGADSILPFLFGMSMLDELLANTRLPEFSLITRLFQNLVLGSDMFYRTYPFEPLVDCESYLDKFDEALINSNCWKRIAIRTQEQGLRCAVYTLRPSLAALGSGFTSQSFSPEAEMALRLVKAPPISLIGYGQISCLAEKIKQTPDSLLKPNPVQALAAIGAALCNDEWKALQWAYLLLNAVDHEPHDETLGIKIPEKIRVNVFEDSSYGIQAVLGAAKILKNHKIESGVAAWGIASSPLKIKALKRQGAMVFDDINLAVENAFAEN
jgi:hypothetical protein